MGPFFAAVLISLFITTAASHDLRKRQTINVQNPPAFQALDQLRGSTPPNAADVQRLMATAVPGVSYPTLSYIPQTAFSCSNVRQPGFYADPETRCQVFRRCEPNNYMFSFICPNTTIFNQISLVCDHWYNVQCENNAQFVDYSNPRIYIQNARLLDDGGSSGSLQSGSYAGGQPQQPLQQQQQQQFQQQPQSPAIFTSGQLQSGRQTSSLYGPSSQLSSGQSGYQQSTGFQASGPSAYSGVFAGSYTPTQQQQQLPFGTMPLQQSSTYPSSPSQYPSSQLQYGSQQQQYSPSAYSQQQLPYSAQIQQSSGPSYRSLSNRLLRIHADASERVNEVVTTQVPAPDSSSHGASTSK